MKILITGAAGFLGLHLTKYFEKKGNALTLIDIADFDSHEYTGPSKKIIADVRDKKRMIELSSEQDVIIHAAAALPLWKKEDIFSVNVDGTNNILEAAKANNVKRVIYISSTAVYGVPKKHPIEENDALVGVGAYGQSKIDAEKLCFNAIQDGLNVTIIRPKTFVGTHRLGVFEILFDWIHDGKRIPVIGSGNNQYQLLDVDDLVEAVYRFTLRDIKKYNDVFNIGAKKYQTVRKDLETLFQKAKSGSLPLSTPARPVKFVLWLFEKLRLSPLYQWVYDTADKDSFVSIEKLRNVLQWEPQYSNSQALIKAYDWYLKNYKDIKSRPAGITHTAGWKQGILGLVKKIM